MLSLSDIDKCLGDWFVSRTLGEIALVVIFGMENIQFATLQATMVVEEQVSLLASEFGRPVFASGVVVVQSAKR